MKHTQLLGAAGLVMASLAVSAHAQGWEHAISLFNQMNQPCLDTYGAHSQQIESELTMFVAKNGEFPPAVEDGGIFGLHEVGTDLQRVKREGLKLYMRQRVREA